MEAKTIMVIDDATEMPAVALRAQVQHRLRPRWLALVIAQETSILKRAGFGVEDTQQQEYVFFAELDGRSKLTYDAHQWGNRTLFVARWIGCGGTATMKASDVLAQERRYQRLRKVFDRELARQARVMGIDDVERVDDDEIIIDARMDVRRLIAALMAEEDAQSEAESDPEEPLQ